MLKKIQDWFMKHSFMLFLFLVIGIVTGIKTCQIYYKNKITESIAIGGMVFENNVYLITKK